MNVQACRRVPLCSAITLFVLAAPLAAAPSAGEIPERVTLGGTIGGAGNGNTWSGGGYGPSMTVHIDVPAVPTARVRFSTGVTSWTPHNDPLGGGMPAGRVRLTHVAGTALRTVVQPTGRYPFGMYGGFGLGSYRYHVQHGPLDHARTWGVHAIGGLEYVLPNRRLVIRGETEIHLVDGPGHAQIWASTLPIMSAAIGVSRRF